MKFANELIASIDHNRFEIAMDRWTALSVHDERASEAALAQADIVVCEWCGPNAVWYSQRVRPSQRLVIRLHRFEISTDFPGMVATDAVSAVVTVSEHYRDLTRSAMPMLDPQRVRVIGNGVDLAAFQLAKNADARFRIGMLGAVPQRKRLDVALDVLSTVRQHDERFILVVKGPLPWDHRWVWNDPTQRSFFADCYRRIQTDPSLLGAVALDPPGPDVPRWLTDIGILLSTSDDESFHLAPAEAMASGAPPIILPWPASSTVYQRRWIVESPESAAERILDLADPTTWAAMSTDALADATRFDHRAVAAEWSDLLDDVNV